MIVEGHGLVAELDGDGQTVHVSEGDGGEGVSMDLDGLRWLAFLAAPTLLSAAEKVLSDPPVNVRDASTDDGQIPGQLAID